MADTWRAAVGYPPFRSDVSDDIQKSEIHEDNKTATTVGNSIATLNGFLLYKMF